MNEFQMDLFVAYYYTNLPGADEQSNETLNVGGTGSRFLCSFLN